MSRRWWRRNLVALAALAVLIPVGVYAIDTIEFGFVRSTDVHVADGGTYQLADWTVGPVTITPLDAAAVGAPSGTDPVLVTIRVDPGHDDFGCRPPTVSDPAGRTWRSDASLDWELDEDQYSYCASDTVVPYDVVHPVLLADDLGDHLTVSVEVAGDGQILDLNFAVTR